MAWKNRLTSCLLLFATPKLPIGDVRWRASETERVGLDVHGGLKIRQRKSRSDTCIFEPSMSLSTWSRRN